MEPKRMKFPLSERATASIVFSTTVDSVDSTISSSWPPERSRVAEGTGPTTPQQPAGRVVPNDPFGNGANSCPVSRGRSDAGAATHPLHLPPPPAIPDGGGVP